MTTCHVPITVRLVGDPERIAEDGLTEPVERAVADRLGVVRRELLARGIAGRDARVVVGEPASTPAERIEANRIDGGEYELPSYDGGRARVPIRRVDPLEEARRALERIHRQLATGIFDWSVSRDEAVAILRILLSLRGEVLLRTVQTMRLTGAWRTFRRALGDAELDAATELDLRIDPNIGILAPGDRIRVEVLTTHGGIDRDLSGEYAVAHDGVTLFFVRRPVRVVGLTPQEAADAIASAYFDALLLAEPFVRVAVTARGYFYAQHGHVNPVPYLSRVSFAATAQAQRARRTASFTNYVRALSAEDPLVGRALHHYFAWIERNAGTREFFTREPADLWRWALEQASAPPPPETPLERFLSFLRVMTNQAAHAPRDVRPRMQAAITRFVTWLDRHRNDPDLGSRDPGDVWARCWLGAFEEELAEQRARRAREAAERQQLVDWSAVERKLDEAIAIVNRRILPTAYQPRAIDVPEEGIGYLIMPSPAERLVRNEIAGRYLHDIISRAGQLDFTRTTALDDFTEWLGRNPELHSALVLTVQHPYVETYAIEVDVEAWQIVVEVGIGFIPIVGQVVAAAEVMSGYSITGRRLSTLERGILAAGVLLPAAAKVGRLTHAAVATSRMAPAYRMSAAEAEAFFRATARISPGTRGNRLLSRAVEDVRAGRPITDQQRVRDLEALTREMGVTESSTARALETRVTGRTPVMEASDDEIAALLREEGWTRPTVTGGRRPRIGDIPVPTRRRLQLDIQDIVRVGTETERQALERVERLIFRRIDQTPLREAWEAARARVLAGRRIETVTRDEMLGVGNRPGLYDQVRDEFWREMRRRPDLERWLDEAGYELREGLAPHLRVNRPGLSAQETRVSLDHLAEKAQGENWRRAIDADNLQFEFQNPNSNREIVQARFRMRSGTPPAAAPGSGPQQGEPPGGGQ